MKSILDPACWPSLQQFLRRDTLMAFDYDGTLAPIVPDPDNAVIRPATAELLRQVTLRFPTVLITGRRRFDMQRFLQGIPVLEVIGNHGSEVYGAEPSFLIRRVAGWKNQLQDSLAGVAGIVIEDKKYSLALHYRRADDSVDARRQIEAAVTELEGARLVSGQSVINVVPRESPHKGAALLAAIERLGCSRALFIGDDDTDEDVFALRQPDRILTVRVGCNEESAAEYYLPDQSQADDFLALLLRRESLLSVNNPESGLRPLGGS